MEMDLRDMDKGRVPRIDLNTIGNQSKISIDTEWWEKIIRENERAKIMRKIALAEIDKAEGREGYTGCISAELVEVIMNEF